MSLTARCELRGALDEGRHVAGADAEGGLAAGIGGLDHGVSAGGQDECDAGVVHQSVGGIDGKGSRSTGCSSPARRRRLRRRGPPSQLRAEHCWAAGWNAKMMGLRVFRAIRLLKIAVDVGFVTGVMPQITPTGSAISVMPEISSLLITPTVLRYCQGMGDLLGDEDVLHGLVLEDTPAGLGDGGLGELAVLVKCGHRGLLDDEIDVALGEGGVGGERRSGLGDQLVDRLGGPGRFGVRCPGGAVPFGDGAGLAVPWVVALSCWGCCCSRRSEWWTRTLRLPIGRRWSGASPAHQQR